MKFQMQQNSIACGKIRNETMTVSVVSTSLSNPFTFSFLLLGNGGTKNSKKKNIIIVLYNILIYLKASANCKLMLSIHASIYAKRQSNTKYMKSVQQIS